MMVLHRGLLVPLSLLAFEGLRRGAASAIDYSQDSAFPPEVKSASATEDESASLQEPLWGVSEGSPPIHRSSQALEDTENSSVVPSDQSPHQLDVGYESDVNKPQLTRHERADPSLEDDYALGPQGTGSSAEQLVSDENQALLQPDADLALVGGAAEILRLMEEAGESQYPSESLLAAAQAAEGVITETDPEVFGGVSSENRRNAAQNISASEENLVPPQEARYSPRHVELDSKNSPLGRILRPLLLLPIAIVAFAVIAFAIAVSSLAVLVAAGVGILALTVGVVVATIATLSIAAGRLVKTLYGRLRRWWKTREARERERNQRLDNKSKPPARDLK